jgi:hypothetical protein
MLSSPLNCPIMKWSAFSLFICVCFQAAMSQEVSRSIAVDQAPDRMKTLKASLVLGESDERIFWPLYEQYAERLSELNQSTVNALQRLIKSRGDDEAISNVKAVLNHQSMEVALKKEYFDKIIQSTNGTVALQFLQGEELFALLVKSKLFEQEEWNYSLWTPALLKSEEVNQTITEFALGVATGDSAKFRGIMSEFEFEYSRVVGHEYVFFEQCIDDPGAWTPGQCKALGNAFISMQVNELKVKEKFFKQFENTFGSSLAAEFISLQECFSTLSKLRVWLDYLSSADAPQR